MHTELLFELMPNESLIEYVLAPLGEAGVTPSKRLILKITAALLKQLNAYYDVRHLHILIPVLEASVIGRPMERSQHLVPHERDLAR